MLSVLLIGLEMCIIPVVGGVESEIPTLAKKPGTRYAWPEKKRIEAVTTYLALGNASLVEATTGVPAATVRQWKTQPWWKELVATVQQESDQQLDTKLGDLIQKSLNAVNDRLENGDFHWDARNGEFVRKPVSLKDSWKVSNEMLDKRWLIRDRPDTKVNTEAVADILTKLANDFAGMARSKLKQEAPLDLVEIEEGVYGSEPREAELQTGICELSGETGTDQKPSGEECREAGVAEGGVGSQG